VSKHKKEKVVEPKILGRPIKYTDEFIENEALEYEKWMENPDNVFATKFAFDRGYPRQTLLEFAEKNKSFSSVFARARARQEHLLAEGALFGRFKEGMAKFLLVNHHNYTEKVQQEVNAQGSLTIQTVSFKDVTALPPKEMDTTNLLSYDDTKQLKFDDNSNTSI
jgi:hypothetical protein